MPVTSEPIAVRVNTVVAIRSLPGFSAFAITVSVRVSTPTSSVPRSTSVSKRVSVDAPLGRVTTTDSARSAPVAGSAVWMASEIIPFGAVTRVSPPRNSSVTVLVPSGAISSRTVRSSLHCVHRCTFAWPVALVSVTWRVTAVGTPVVYTVGS